jgi:hypothetical protein
MKILPYKHKPFFLDSGTQITTQTVDAVMIFEILMAGTIKTAVFWDMTFYTLV